MRVRLMSLLATFSILAACDGKEDDPESGGSATDSVDSDADGYDADEDCDDTDPNVYPGATEVCDGIDNDCSGLVDDDAIDMSTWYGDHDGDGFGAPDAPVEACEAEEGQVDNADDCNDGDALVNPAADEVCDGEDNDCDLEVDEDAVDAPTWYADADSDGFGDPTTGETTCAAPSGYIADSTDCDDTAAAAFPGGIEVCDTLDNDCDGTVDNNFLHVPGTYATIQAAVDAATAGDEVCVAAGTYSETVELGVDLTISGSAGSAAVVIDAGGGGSVVAAESGGTFTLRGLTLTGGSNTFGAGLTLIGAEATLEDVVVTGNTSTGASYAGAGIGAEDSILALTHCEVSDNHVTEDRGQGAGILALDSIVALDDVVLSGNTITGQNAKGGGLHADGGTLEVSNATVTGNQLLGDIAGNTYPLGAGLSVNGTEVVVRDSEFRENTITQTATSHIFGRGAALSLVSEDITLERVLAENNTIDLESTSFVYIEGVGIYAEGWKDTGGTTRLTDVELRDNDGTSVSTGFFAVVYGVGATLYGDNANEVDGLTITGNTGTVTQVYSSGFLTGVALEAFEGSITGSHLDVRDNVGTSNADVEGGIINLEWTTWDVSNIIVAGNSVTTDRNVNGGIVKVLWDDDEAYVRQDPADAIFTNADFVGNSASGQYVWGGVFPADDMTLLSLVNTNIAHNTVTGSSVAEGTVGAYDSEAESNVLLTYVNSYGNTGAPSDWVDNDLELSLSTLALDPAYTDISATAAVDWDLTLSAGSAAIDAGDPTILDADGSTSDLGAFGGPLGVWTP